MTVWLNRAGSHGEYEQKFIQENKIYATWEDLNQDLKALSKREEMIQLLTESSPDSKPKTIQNWTGQLWSFVHEMKVGDLVFLPLKFQPAYQIGEIVGDYQYDSAAEDPFYHSRPVKWIGEAIPRSNFSQDLKYSLGAFLTICRIKRNNAEERIAAMRANNWKPETVTSISSSVESDEGVTTTNLEELSQDQIAQLIKTQFKGHDLTRLVEAILQAKGYTTYRSPEGADGGADILAGASPLGFGKPTLCVEVKSEDAPIDRPTVDKLIGAVTKFGAQHGLFVSLSGFKSTVQKELATSFFNVRLWSQKELLEELFNNYDNLDEEIKVEIPLKRVWMVTTKSEE